MKKKFAIEDMLKEFLSQKGASTQEELCEKFISLGIPMTQSSISRWLRKIRAVKVHGKEGCRYVLPESSEEFKLCFLVSSVRYNLFMIVIRTAPGSASWVAGILDKQFPKEILGTLAGDDTIFIAPAKDQNLPDLAQTLANFLQVSCA
ncbi:arginine repressor [Chlamydia pecorum]|uniref:arginine repressor n=1 Tax=Chlamydia pecorum TaxID=85991 RepID=UPI0003AE377B|nr:arginine repressor [Chlamydia pecorum]AGW38980.1 arginine repressor [Chlamydia pecorum W73]AGW39906.1 arginine repressor [Chlamydia pecorum P787]ETF37631.1 arginine repressor [Chlamydia pecorum VR629]